MLKTIAVLGFGAAAGAVYARIDGLLLLRMSGDHDAGLYAAAYRFYDQARIVPFALMTPLAPLLARQLRHGRMDACTDTTILSICVFGGLGVAALIAGAAPVVVPAVLGERYEASGELLVLVGSISAWSLVSYVGTAKLVYGGRELTWLFIALLGIAVNVAANVIAIPRWGPHGAAYATILTELLVVLLYAYASRTFSSAAYLTAIPLLAVAALAAAAVSVGAARSEHELLEWVTRSVLLCLGAICCALGVQRVRRLSVIDAA
jgi:O-antigen/teichoic acid export membrane protein